MARFFITGSSDGLGLLTAKKLISLGHTVVLHARNTQRAQDASAACPGAEAVLTADLSSISEIKSLASEADKHGPYEAIIHNAGVYTDMSLSKDGYSTLFTVNVLAPWILTCLMKPPKRLVYISSGLHRQGRSKVITEDVKKSNYNDSKLVMTMLAKAVLRRGVVKEAYSVDPGWVPTKMGGSSATGDLQAAVDTFVKVALGHTEGGKNGGYWFNGREEGTHPDAGDDKIQNVVLEQLKEVTGLGIE
ncbi:hypothetical protein QBC38DRAFT_478000 [Podospora fimiseda]|uniref:Uncharacterized protein n=1 Tax=Podospora fimiseda TaxID=252190 RepID=A0AAN7BPX3_9PEZI|nr:hypothetical protein QBC38DRAFT_478000 [Podospora fimiseda]